MLGQSVTAIRTWTECCIAWASRFVDRYPGFWQYVRLTGGVSIWLLSRTVSRAWARCYNDRAVRNSESLRGLHAVLLERRGQNRCSQLVRVESSELGTKAEPCLSTTDQVNSGENMAKVCQALTHTKSSEQIGRARALSYPEPCRHIVYGSYGFAVSKPCRHIVDGSYGFVVSNSCAGITLTVPMALLCPIALRAYRWW